VKGWQQTTMAMQIGMGLVVVVGFHTCWMG
jgi:hypothetical protein